VNSDVPLDTFHDEASLYCYKAFPVTLLLPKDGIG
jgi:hypothetical protein